MFQQLKEDSRFEISQSGIIRNVKTKQYLNAHNPTHT